MLLCDVQTHLTDLVLESLLDELLHDLAACLERLERRGELEYRDEGEAHLKRTNGIALSITSVVRPAYDTQRTACSSTTASALEFEFYVIYPHKGGDCPGVRTRGSGSGVERTKQSSSGRMISARASSIDLEEPRLSMACAGA